MQVKQHGNTFAWFMYNLISGLPKKYPISAHPTNSVYHTDVLAEVNKQKKCWWIEKLADTRDITHWEQLILAHGSETLFPLSTDFQIFVIGGKKPPKNSTFFNGETGIKYFLVWPKNWMSMKDFINVNKHWQMLVNSGWNLHWYMYLQRLPVLSYTKWNWQNVCTLFGTHKLHYTFAKKSRKKTVVKLHVVKICYTSHCWWKSD